MNIGKLKDVHTIIILENEQLKNNNKDLQEEVDSL